MAHPLSGTRLKICRAEEHLNTLKTAIRMFLEANPYSLIFQPNPAPPQYALCANINQIPPLQWSCIVGDFAHNARSALDLLVYQLSDLLAGDNKRLKLYFPIFDSPTEYAQRENGYLAGVKPEYRTIIERYQPYKRSQGHGDDALGILRRINDGDKHRIIHVVGAIANLNYFIFDGSSKGLPDSIQFGQGASMRVGNSFDFGNGFTGTKVGNGEITRDGAKVWELTIPQPEQMEVNPDLQITVQFRVSDPGIQGHPVVDTLTLIYDRVKEVIGEFEPFFPK